MLRLLALLAATVAMLIGCSKEPYVALPPLLSSNLAKPVAPAEMRRTRQNAGASCNIESIDRAAFADQPLPVPKGDILVNGWLLPEISHKAVLRAGLRFLNEAGTAGWQASISRWVSREDVLTAMNAPDGGDTGFGEYVDTRAIPPGSYHLLIVFDDRGIGYLCDKNRKVVVQ